MLRLEEEGNFKLLLYYASAHPHTKYTFFDDAGNSITATCDTIYETENGLELDDPDYEEYMGIAFKDEETGTLFEINYHNLPASVLCDGVKLY